MFKHHLPNQIERENGQRGFFSHQSCCKWRHFQTLRTKYMVKKLSTNDKWWRLNVSDHHLLKKLLLSQIGEQFPTLSEECREVKTLCRPINLKAFLLLRINDAGTFMPVMISYRHLYLPLPNQLQPLECGDAIKIFSQTMSHSLNE